MSNLKARLITRNGLASEWYSVNPILLKGELALETDTHLLKAGDGISNYADLPYLNDNHGGEGYVSEHYEVEASAEQSDMEALEAAGIMPQDSDTAIVKRIIADGKYSYTGYVYQNGNWMALDGNYSAENVYFTEDLIATVAVGTITIPSSGSAIVPAAGKSVKDVLASILAKEKNPTITQPSVSVSFVGGQSSYEVGSVIAPTYKATFNAGSYSYGPATNVAVTDWAVTDSLGNSFDSNSATAPEFLVEDGMVYSVTAKAYHTEGNIPKTNIGNSYPAGKIAEGNKSGTSTKITSYRSYFYGVVENKDEITSDMIRGLTRGGAYNAKKTLTINASSVENPQRIIVAVPQNSGRSGLTKVILTTSMNADITSEYNPSVVEVEGANGYAAANYDVYCYSPAAMDVSEIHEITLA